MYFYMESNFKDFKKLKFYILKVLKQNVSSLVKYFFLIFFFFFTEVNLCNWKCFMLVKWHFFFFSIENKQTNKYFARKKIKSKSSDCTFVCSLILAATDVVRSLCDSFRLSFIFIILECPQTLQSDTSSGESNFSHWKVHRKWA